MTVKSELQSSKLVRTTLTNSEALPYPALGVCDIGKRSASVQTFAFQKPVWSFGATYRSNGDVKLGTGGSAAKSSPVSYTLSDGTVVNVGAPGALAGTLPSTGKTFVGVIDKTGKGIVSVRVGTQGTLDASQPLYIEDIAFALAGPPPGNWKLTMDDEFDGNALNPAHWAPGYTFPDVINREMQGYVPENVTVGGGVCTIKTESRPCVNTDRTGRKGASQQIASGAFTSFDKFTQTYGYFEARIKMPISPGPGLWPAFWMLPDRGSVYQDPIRRAYRAKDAGMGSEIDIFEYQPIWKRADGTSPIHVGTIWSYAPVSASDPAPHAYGGYSLGNDGWGPEEMNYPKLDGQFHTYGIYWSHERLIYYVDSKPIFRVRDPKNVPDVPEYFLFNIAVTGNAWGKSPGKANPTTDAIKAALPGVMEIDYFRAYSGTLEESIPTAQTDLPVIRKYSPTTAAMPSAPPAPASQAAAPAAPVNSSIATPAQ